MAIGRPVTPASHPTGLYINSMKAIELRIVKRLPSHWERILRACFCDAAVAELCRDYDTVLTTIEAEQPDADSRWAND